MNTRQRIESVVKNTTENRGEKRKSNNPEGKNQTTYKAARDAMHAYCEFHPEKVVACIESIVSATIAGDAKMARIWVDLFGGAEKQQLELSGSLETTQRVSVLDNLSGEELDYLIKLKESANEA